jgi:hypothetical protein
MERRLDRKDDGSKEPTKESRQMAERLFRQMEEDDYVLLSSRYQHHKRLLTETTPDDRIHADFEYQEIETEGLLYGYLDVLPFGEVYSVTIADNTYEIFDRYCLLEHCPCTDATVSLMDMVMEGEKRVGHEMITFALDYRKKSWRLEKRYQAPFSKQQALDALKSQHPDLVKKLAKRHARLKAIYAHCKKRDYQPQQPIQLEKVGRNAPCPCGSGKKYKYCCYNN